MTRTELLGLQNPPQTLALESSLHGIAAMTVDDTDIPGSELYGCIDNVL
jgi:hypothetical protein